MGTCGLTRLDHSLTRRAPPSRATRTIPISVMRSPPACVPVVSRSTKAKAGRSEGSMVVRAKAVPRSRRSVLTSERSFGYCSAVSNDRSYLARLQDYYATHRALPSYASIGSLLGLKSKSSVAALVARLKLAGYLEATPDRRLAPTKRFFARPLASVPVRAGLPEAVEDDDAD